jgi:methylthioribose-1-phosphate isomerase
MRAVDWVDGRFRFIDQTLLPQQEVWVDTDDLTVVGEAIRTLRVRGAPAIGVAAAFGLLLALHPRTFSDVPDLRGRLRRASAYLAQTRPTAVNLFYALDRMRGVLDRHAGQSEAQLYAALEREACAIQREDIEACRRIGELGAELIVPGSSLLTHCNAGALATAGDGTALSIVTTAARQGKIVRVYVDETRPLLQGARLTAWELEQADIPVVLITDSTAGTVLREGRVQAVIVGADRVAANGDAANKVGTYPLAVLAQRHGVSFYVAVPTSTLDPDTPSGDGIPIEERDPAEITHFAGVVVAPAGVGVYAPAFDVTPNELITAIVTERGVLRPPYVQTIADVLKAR